MSVINQMLKDLDQRQAEHQSSQVNSPLPHEKKSSLKLIAIIVVVVLMLNIMGIVFWQLYTENKSLKGEQIHSAESLKHNQQAQQLVNSIDNAYKTEAASEKIQAVVEASLNEAHKRENQLPLNNNKDNDEAVNAQQISRIKNDMLKDAQKIEFTQSVETANNAQPVKAVNESKIAQTSTQGIEGKQRTSLAVKNVSDSSLTIKRKQLSPQALVKQKIEQAEQALAMNKLKRAEQLFEDVLLVIPEHSVARKQLAALWFGRQSYQAAINLLSRGLQLAPNNSEFRIMKARIYFKQGQSLQAVNTLKATPEVANVEYQRLLATNAQQLSQFTVAIKAYQHLTQLAPNVGRWWLGLAVALDSNSEFERAISAYVTATEKADLSESAKQFALQRAKELGEN